MKRDLSHYYPLLAELKAMSADAPKVKTELRKAHGPKLMPKAEIASLVKSVRGPKAFRKSMADAESHPILALTLKPALDLQAARVKYAELNAALTRAASTGNISANEASRAEAELNRLGCLIVLMEGGELMSGEDANARNRRGPQ